MRTRAWVVGVALLAAGGCGSRTLRAGGEPCSASSECEAGLLCDFGQATPVCAGMSTVADGAPPPPDADPAAPDAAPGTPDAAPDAAPPDAAPPDAAPPDAAI